MPLLSTVYCELEDLQRFMTTQGVTDWADHDADGMADTDIVEDCINQATEEIDLYARQRYTQAVLSTSTLINRWCMVMATRFLCHRRGNSPPASVEVEWERISQHLEDISQGKKQLPGMALRDDLRPTMSNLKIDRRFRHSKIRVRPNSSDPPTKLTKDRVIDEQFPYE